MGNCCPVLTPLAPNSHLEPATLEEMAEFNSLWVSYRSAIGSINYLSTATCPDLSFVVSSLSQFLDRPGIKHWQGFLHVLRYLNSSQDLGLTYGGELNVVSPHTETLTGETVRPHDNRSLATSPASIGVW
ncbi:hypothetical protein O181_112645 [Austropuccinia psidii MF-1]|uniref:Uncharacterized protein n=1 Tax=Austropuccinia psidii MF-1 TaxID=1389203 RepID=A0A9Q3PTR1_9BASI|nr:hypothetical protein [Austropuccinia psidii MF-1]